MSGKTKIAIIGGGFMGCALAISLDPDENHILLFEKNASILMEASSKNQGRLHYGLFQFNDKSRAQNIYANQLKFRQDFNDVLIDSIESYYIFIKGNKLIHPNTFFSNLTKWGIPIKKIDNPKLGFFKHELIEQVFLTNEKVINHIFLKTSMKDRLKANKVDLLLNSKVNSIYYDSNRKRFEISSNGKIYFSHIVFCSIYSETNILLKESGIKTINYDLVPTELFHLKLEEKYNNIGISIIDDCFKSILPYKSQSNHSFTHYNISKLNEAEALKELALSDIKKYFDKDFKSTIEDSHFVNKIRINENEFTNNILADWGCNDFHIIIPRYITDFYNILNEIKIKKLYTSAQTREQSFGAF